jgi:hypothetical protein
MKPRRKEKIEKPWRRWENNIKIEPKGIGWGDMDCVHLVQDGGE